MPTTSPPDARREVVQRHSRYYLSLFARHTPDLRAAQQWEAAAALEAEIDNLRAAWRAAVELHELALTRAALDATFIFNEMRCYYQEAEATLAWSAQTLAAEIEAGWLGGTQAELLLQALRVHWSWFAMRVGRRDQAKALYEAASRSCTHTTLCQT